MKQVNAKLLNDHIKKGWTATDFATYLGISDELFWDILKKEFTRNAYEGFRSSLRKNEKHQKRLTKSSNLRTSETHEEVVEELHNEYHEENNEETTTEDDMSSNVEITTESEETEENTSQSDEHVSISELEAKCQQSLDILSDLEIQHKDLVSERCAIRNEISNHQEEFKKMLEEISKRQQAIEDLQKRFNSIGETMENITLQIRNTKLDIAQLKTQIDQAKKVYIYACDSGEVEIDSNLSFEIENWKPVFDNIVTDDELESLTIKQLKALAKTITLIRFLIAQNAPYEVVFEDKISEAYFKKVIS